MLRHTIQSIGPRVATFKDDILIAQSLLAWMSPYSKNKMYHKMQREKLYNLHTKVYFNYIFFVSKKNQNSVQSIFAIVKKTFSKRTRILFFLFYLFIAWYVFFEKNQMYHKMQREKLYNLQTEVYLNCVPFMFKKTPNTVRSVSTMAKIGCTDFWFFFETKNI